VEQLKVIKENNSTLQNKNSLFSKGASFLDLVLLLFFVPLTRQEGPNAAFVRAQVSGNLSVASRRRMLLLLLPVAVQPQWTVRREDVDLHAAAELRRDRGAHNGSQRDAGVRYG